MSFTKLLEETNAKMEDNDGHRKKKKKASTSSYQYKTVEESSSDISEVVKSASESKRKKTKTISSEHVGEISPKPELEIEPRSHSKKKSKNKLDSKSKKENGNMEEPKYNSGFSSDEKDMSNSKVKKKKKRKHLLITSSNSGQMQENSETVVKKKRKKEPDTCSDATIEMKKDKVEKRDKKQHINHNSDSLVEKDTDSKCDITGVESKSHKAKKSKTREDKKSTKKQKHNKETTDEVSIKTTTDIAGALEADGNKEGPVGEADTPDSSALKVIKKKKKSKLPDISTDSEPVSTGNAKTNSIQYLHQWSDDRANWRFQKVRQVWLLNPKHMYDTTQITDEDFSKLLGYMEGLKGHAREITLGQAEKIMDSEEPTEEAEKVSLFPDADQNRAREVIQLLS